MTSRWTSFWAAPLGLLLLLMLAPSARAAGTVQLTMEGYVANRGGQRIELQVQAGSDELALRVQFGEGASAGDIAQYLMRRLRTAGIGHSQGADKSPSDPVVIYLENVERIEVHMGGNLRFRLTSMDALPTGLEVKTPRQRAEAERSDLEVTVILEDAQTAEWLPVHLGLAISSRSSSAAIASDLNSLAQSNSLTSQVEGESSWTTTGRSGVGSAVSMTAQVRAYGDWGLVMHFAPVVTRR